MNQIICTSGSNIEPITENYKKRNLFKVLFIILVSTSVFLSIYYVYFRYDLYKYEKVSKSLIDNYSITRALLR